jgi:hypothetical protein
MNDASPPTHANRLAGSPSPYLRQHAANPVDWHPWGPEAFERARCLDRPVFLSVGYSSCHWCHVMAHESFEDPSVADLLNRLFVCVKVDREERPDIDAVYMRATQWMTGRGGWPNSVWLTPDGRPWFAGTYFPPGDRGGAIGLRTLSERIGAVWRERRVDVGRQADEVAAAVRRAADPAAAFVPEAGASPDPVAAAAAWLREEYDPDHGGFRGAPKFPPHGELELLLDLHARTGAAEWLDKVTGTLRAMQAGGIHDHAGGGFHRYAVDEDWFLPHFEKMLSDNARLLRTYAAASVRSGRPDFAAAARGIAGWMLREMRAPDGGFFTALDADSPGGEGRFYLWADDELAEVLGPDDHEFVRRVFGARPGGNAHDEATGRPTGLNLLHRAGGGRPGDESRVPAVMSRLRLAREARPRPALDDKILAAWNGLAIGALASAGHALAEPAWVEAAGAAAEFAWTRLRTGDGRLRRSFAGGAAHHAACLDDHAFLAEGFLDLHDASGDVRWLDRAGELAGEILGRFRDRERGGFFFTADDHEPLIARIRDPFDDALPSGNAVACLVLQRLYRATQSEVYRVMAEETLRAFSGVIRGGARGASCLLRAWIAGREAVSQASSASRG